MLTGLFTAASGMEAQQRMVDNISNNLANVNTTGYKKRRVNFQDLLYQTLQRAGTLTTAESQAPTGIQIGHGTRAISIQPIFTNGALAETENPLDLAIDGEGFFRVILPDGGEAYTRDGSFQLDSTGSIVTGEGYLLDTDARIDGEDVVDIGIAQDGTVSVLRGEEDKRTEAGRIELFNFVNPAGLHWKGGNLMSPTDASGDPIPGTPGEDNLGFIRQRFLELSNVQVVEELVNLIVAQRAYEVNSKVIQTTDEMLQEANNLRR
jgi:flagellar basal-body rod protein FlgG